MAKIIKFKKGKVTAATIDRKDLVVIKADSQDTISLNDLQSQISAAATDDERFNKSPDAAMSGKCYPSSIWCADVQYDESEDQWSAIIQGCDGKLYSVSFDLDDDGKVTLGDDEEEVVRKTQYVNASYRDFFFGGKLVKAADGHVEGKPTMHQRVGKMSAAVTDAVKDDPRFRTGKDSGGRQLPRPMDGQYDYNKPYVADVLVPDDDGKHHAVIRRDDGKLVKHGFDYDADADTAKMDAGDSEETECTAVYTSLMAAHDEVVRAGGPGSGPQKTTESDKAQEATSKAKEASKAAKNSNDDGELHHQAAVAHLDAAEAHYKAAAEARSNGDVSAAKNHITEGDKHDEKAYGHSIKSNTLLAQSARDSVKTARKKATEGLVTAAGTTPGAFGGHATKKSDAATEASTNAQVASDKANASGEPKDHGDAADAHRTAADAHQAALEAHTKAGSDRPTLKKHADMMGEHDKQAECHDGKCGDGKDNPITSANRDPLPQPADAKNADSLSEKADTASAKANESGVVDDHKAAAAANKLAAAACNAAQQKAKSESDTPNAKKYAACQARHAAAVTEHEAFKVQAAEAEAEIGASRGEEKDLVHCGQHNGAKGAGSTIDPKAWSLDKTADITWMPGGVTTVCAGYAKRAILLTVECDEKTVGVVNASYAQWKSEMPKQEPFICLEHEEKEAAGHPKKFEWKDDGDNGRVTCSVLPSETGVTKVNGRTYRSFSPSFTTDAEYHKAKCEDCSKSPSICKCNGTLTFPDGVRGSESNPARVTGIGFSIGSLTNKPAFKNMPPVKARQGGQPEPTIDIIFAELARQARPPEPQQNGANNKGNEMNKKVIILKAHGTYTTVGAEVELPAADAETLIKSGHAEDAGTNKLNKMVRAGAASRVKDAITAAKGRNAIPVKDTETETTILAKLNEVSIDGLELVTQLTVDQINARNAQANGTDYTQRQIEGQPDGDAGSRARAGFSLRGEGTSYVTASTPMDKLIKDGNIKEAIKLSKARSLNMKAIIGASEKTDFSMKDLVTAADDVDPGVGTLNTGLVLMRNLGFLKNKLSFLPYISTDLRNEPVAFGQNVLTRYITPPNVLTYVPGIGMTSDATTITNWKATITAANPAGTTQTTGTQTYSAASATDVSVVLNNYNGVEIQFTNMTLASTMRNLFAEQQAAQLYSLAEYINQQFLLTIFKSVWSGISAAPFQLCGGIAPVGTSAPGPNQNPMGLANIIAVKNKFTMNKMPDNGRFALLHSAYHDAILTDSNMLTAKSILALIKKDTGAFEDGELPTLFGVKVLESQLAAYKNAALVTITDPAQIPNTATTIGFAGNAASALFVARVPQDYTKVIPDIPATAALEIVTEPDSGLSMLIVKRVNNQIESTFVRCGLMFGFAQGDPRQGFLLNP